MMPNIFAAGALSSDRPPQVFFVGAGPGDPDLLTVRALRLLREADIVLHDALVPEATLALARADAQIVCVGKRANGACVPQSEINRLLVGLAAPGRRLVRLKGGDPAIFARLGEETAALRAAGIDFEITPGVTTASAAAAAAGLSLTLRGKARRTQFVAAHARAGEALELDWASLADPQATTAFYMAREAAALIARRLCEHGLDPLTPALLMSDVSRAGETRLRAPLSRLPEAVRLFHDEAPLIVLVGAALAEPDESLSSSLFARSAAPN